MPPLHLGEKGSILPEPHIPRILLPACSQITRVLGSTGPPSPHPLSRLKACTLSQSRPLAAPFLPPPAHLLEAYAM